MEDVLDRVGNAEVLGLVQDVNLFGVRIERPARTANERPRLPKNCTILLRIDEIQTVPGEPDDESAHILQHLESGSDGQAILPVLADLSNSLNVLRKLGLSRHGDAPVTYMKPLSRADVAAATRQFSQHFGVAGLPATQRRWERTLYRWSKGWPKHLQRPGRSW